MAGEYDPAAYRFDNARYPRIYEDLAYFLTRLREVNPGAKQLLTVSPVPLAAISRRAMGVGLEARLT